MPSDPYEARLRRVVQHIYDTPAGDLSLDALADVAAMSRFHWHRVFRAMTGMTCAQCVRAVRMHRASVWLVQTDWPVATIAARVGYGDLRGFTRAFREAYGMTPTAFRKAGTPGPFDMTLTRGDQAMSDAEIRTLPELRLAALPHTGAYHQIGKAFQQVAAVFNARGLWPHARGMVALYHDDPSSMPEASLRSHAGIRVEEGFALPDVLTEVRLPGGPHAIVTHKGPYAGLPAAWDALYSGWLPQSGHVPADSPPFEIYLNDPTDTAPADLLTEICVPLASGQ